MKGSTLAIVAVGGALATVGAVFALKPKAPVVTQQFQVPTGGLTGLPANNYSTPTPHQQPQVSAAQSTGLPLWAQLGLAGVAALSPIAIAALK